MQPFPEVGRPIRDAQDAPIVQVVVVEIMPFRQVILGEIVAGNKAHGQENFFGTIEFEGKIIYQQVMSLGGGDRFALPGGLGVEKWILQLPLSGMLGKNLHSDMTF